MVMLLLLAVLTTVPAWTQEDLAKQSQNPIGNIISLPFENNFDFGASRSAGSKCVVVCRRQ